MDDKIIIEALQLLAEKKQSEILKLENDIEKRSKEDYILYKFIKKLDKKLLKQFVEMAYKEDPDICRSAVESLHDETIDLSKIECTGNDFKTW